MKKLLPLYQLERAALRDSESLVTHYVRNLDHFIRVTDLETNGLGSCWHPRLFLVLLKDVQHEHACPETRSSAFLRTYGGIPGAPLERQCRYRYAPQKPLDSE